MGGIQVVWGDPGSMGGSRKWGGVNGSRGGTQVVGGTHVVDEDPGSRELTQ